MSLSVTTLTTTTSKLAIETDAGATAISNVFSGAATLRTIEIDNGGGAAVYLKLYDATGPTIGTTAPDLILLCPASSKRTYIIADGVAFGTGVSMACVKAGGTAGTGSPSGTQKVYLTTF
jgi:hypothetical protein